MGESAAAAGALSLEDAARVICRRSKLMTRIAGAGAMGSVELPRQASELSRWHAESTMLWSRWEISQSTVIGGTSDTVRDLIARWEQRDVMAREVAVDVASHSPQVDPILDDGSRRWRTLLR
ncbi:acyltransferase domain-containing protein [Mycobacterium tuberculosis]